jgi:hypothetical protein
MHFCEIVNQAASKYRGPLRSGFSRKQELMDILIKPHSDDAVGLSSHRFTAKIGIHGMVGHLTSRPKSSARSKKGSG